MAELKTKQTNQSATKFLNAIDDKKRRQDCRVVLKIMKQATKAPPRMWGKNIVGLGNRHYKYASGREGDWFVAGFSPRKQDLTLYLTPEFEGREALLGKLGKHKTGKSCLYIKNLDDVDLEVLQKLVTLSVRQTRSS